MEQVSLLLSETQHRNLANGKTIQVKPEDINKGHPYMFSSRNYKKLLRAYHSGKGVRVSFTNDEMSANRDSLEGGAFNVRKIANKVGKNVQRGSKMVSNNLGKASNVLNKIDTVMDYIPGEYLPVVGPAYAALHDGVGAAADITEAGAKLSKKADRFIQNPTASNMMRAASGAMAASDGGDTMEGGSANMRLLASRARDSSAAMAGGAINVRRLANKVGRQVKLGAKKGQRLIGQVNDTMQNIDPEAFGKYADDFSVLRDTVGDANAMVNGGSVNPYMPAMGGSFKTKGGSFKGGSFKGNGFRVAPAPVRVYDDNSNFVRPDSASFNPVGPPRYGGGMKKKCGCTCPHCGR